jgi:triosephosphate isomerase
MRAQFVTPEQPRLAIGVSLKMYFGHRQTLDWVSQVARIAAGHPAVRTGVVEVFVVPSFPALAPSVALLSGTAVSIGAQDVFWEDAGAFTGEVSGAELAEIGCTLVELGHAERRRIFGETDAVVSAKTHAAYRNGLTPLLCIGEATRQEPNAAAAECVRQLDAALADSRAAGITGPLLLAYEPQWAIGAAEPADPDYIAAVSRLLRSALAADSALGGSRVIYGGSAGPGLLSRLGGSVDGLFLGRFAHDPLALESILDEALSARIVPSVLASGVSEGTPA